MRRVLSVKQLKIRTVQAQKTQRCTAERVETRSSAPPPCGCEPVTSTGCGLWAATYTCTWITAGSIMSAPPVPPRPYDGPTGNGDRPPPLPPLPPDLKAQAERYNTPSFYELDSPPHFENPLIAPRPHRVDPALPANVSSPLSDSLPIS